MHIPYEYEIKKERNELAIAKNDSQFVLKKWKDMLDIF